MEYVEIISPVDDRKRVASCNPNSNILSIMRLCKYNKTKRKKLLFLVAGLGGTFDYAIYCPETLTVYDKLREIKT